MHVCIVRCTLSGHYGSISKTLILQKRLRWKKNNLKLLFHLCSSPCQKGFVVNKSWDESCSLAQLLKCLWWLPKEVHGCGHWPLFLGGLSHLCAMRIKWISSCVSMSSQSLNEASAVWGGQFKRASSNVTVSSVDSFLLFCLMCSTHTGRVTTFQHQFI